MLWTVSQAIVALRVQIDACIAFIKHGSSHVTGKEHACTSNQLAITSPDLPGQATKVWTNPGAGVTRSSRCTSGGSWQPSPHFQQSADLSRACACYGSIRPDLKGVDVSLTEAYPNEDHDAAHPSKGSLGIGDVQQLSRSHLQAQGSWCALPIALYGSLTKHCALCLRFLGCFGSMLLQQKET